jgi:hypothetical protein
MKRSSVSLVIRERQIKSTMKHLTPTRMAVIIQKDHQKIVNVGKNCNLPTLRLLVLEKLKFSYILTRNEKWCSCFGKQFSNSSKS